VELVTDDDPPAFLGRVSLAARVQLLRDDTFASTRDGEPALQVRAPRATGEPA
jgi:hypothetical protein